MTNRCLTGHCNCLRFGCILVGSARGAAIFVQATPCAPKPGGIFKTLMTGPDGFHEEGAACILEVVPGKRIVWTTALGPGYRPNEFTSDGCNGFPFTAIHSFEDAGGGKTRYTATVVHANAADAEAHAAMGFDSGWATCAEQMAEVARSLA